jgi:hypothetical protein
MTSALEQRSMAASTTPAISRSRPEIACAAAAIRRIGEVAGIPRQVCPAID